MKSGENRGKQGKSKESLWTKSEKKLRKIEENWSKSGDQNNLMEKVESKKQLTFFLKDSRIHLELIFLDFSCCLVLEEGFLEI